MVCHSKNCVQYKLFYNCFNIESTNEAKKDVLGDNALKDFMRNRSKNRF